MFKEILKDCGFDDNDLEYEEEELTVLEKGSIIARSDLLPIMDDGSKQWSSTYFFLKRAIRLQNAIDETAKDDDLRKHQLHDEDWLVLKQVFSFLEEFALITTYVEGSPYPTLSLVLPMYNQLLTHLEDVSLDTTKHALVVKGAKAGLQELSAYYDKASPVMITATYLDPRCKMKYFVNHGWNGGRVGGALNGTNEVDLITTRVKPA